MWSEPSGLRQPSNIVTPGGYFVTADMREWVPPGPDRLVDLPDTSDVGTIYNTPSLNQRLSYRTTQNGVTSVETEKAERRTAPPAQVSINGGLIQYDYETNAYGEPVLVARSVYEESNGGEKGESRGFPLSVSQEMTADSVTLSGDNERQAGRSTAQRASSPEPGIRKAVSSGGQTKPTDPGTHELEILRTPVRKYKEVRSTVSDIDVEPSGHRQATDQTGGHQPSSATNSLNPTGREQKARVQMLLPQELSLPLSIPSAFSDQTQAAQTQQKSKQESSVSHVRQVDSSALSDVVKSSSQQAPAERTALAVSTSSPVLGGGLEAQLQSLLLKQLEALDKDQIDALLDKLMSEAGTSGASTPPRRVLRGQQSSTEQAVKNTEGIEKFLALDWLGEMALDALTAHKMMLSDTVGFQNLLQYGENVINAKWEAQIKCLTPVAMGFTPLGAVIVDLANTSDSASVIRNDLFEAFIKGNRENQRKPLVTVTEVANMRDVRRDFLVVVCTRPGRFVSSFAVSIAFAGQDGKVSNVCPVEVCKSSLPSGILSERRTDN